MKNMMGSAAFLRFSPPHFRNDLCLRFVLLGHQSPFVVRATRIATTVREASRCWHLQWQSLLWSRLAEDILYSSKYLVVEGAPAWVSEKCEFDHTGNRRCRSLFTALVGICGSLKFPFQHLLGHTVNSCSIVTRSRFQRLDLQSQSQRREPN